MSAAAFRNLLEAGNVQDCMRFWAQAAPHLPQPSTAAQAEALMHHARSQAETVAFAKRAYSHRWLTERGMPSGLPDNLRPKAERMYPRIVGAVGIACKTVSATLAPAAILIRTAMEDAVQHCYADGRTEPGFVKMQMQIARADESRRLFGSLTARPTR